ncbi:MAG TPA: ABC transporter substrate-binding protein [Deltaproteobacteria bacterium]|nr:ABC transporter substrate-binding protein [Deltaproteobacteria bacterium]HQI80481.1 ABC transporter substrate-binding protein [Deltaproteobacteria bacterium]
MNWTLVLLAWAAGFLLAFPAPTVHAADTVRVAAIFAKTGDAAAPNLMYFYGARMAVDEINRGGGLLGSAVELVEIDSQSTALGSKAAAEQAVRQKVTAVIGGARSSDALAMAPVLQAAHIPMISPTATIPEFTLIGEYIFRACFVDDFQGAVMAAFALRDLRARTAVVLTNTGNKYSMALARTFIEKYSGGGGKVLMEGEYLEGVTDFKALLERVRRLYPEVVFIPGYCKDAGFIMKTAAEMGMKLHYLGGDGWNGDMISQYAGDAVEGSYSCSYWHRNSPDSQSSRFANDFEAIYGRILSPSPALTYDAFMLLAHAIQHAYSSDPKKIRDALASTRNFQGITGEITFDRDRNPVNKAVVILRHLKGSTVYVKTFRP